MHWPSTQLDATLEVPKPWLGASVAMLVVYAQKPAKPHDLPNCTTCQTAQNIFTTHHDIINSHDAPTPHPPPFEAAL